MTKKPFIFFMFFIMLIFMQSLSAEVVDIGNDELKQLLARGVVLVDIRTPGEWQETGVIEGSQRLMFFNERRQANPQIWLSELNNYVTPEEEVILICRSGNRTKAVAAFLSEKVGYRKVYNVEKGIRAWIAQGNKTVAP